MKKLFLLPLLILLVIGFILTGCAGTSSSTSTPPPSTQPASTQPASSTPPATTPAATKEVTIALITNLANSMGNQIMQLQDLLAEMDNAKGGLKIGNDYYKVKVISYSNDDDNNKGIAAANRLIYDDKVKFIVSHDLLPDFLCPISEPEKVLTFSNAAIWNSGFLDKYHYNFSLLGQGTHEVSVAGWLCETYPEMKGPNGLAMAFPDNMLGHQFASLIAWPYKRMGAQPEIVYFPADQRDLSSLGTKIASMNPAWYMGNVGAAEAMALATGAAYDAGYRGNYFTFITSDVGLLEPVMKPEILEGFIAACSAMETGDYGGCLTAYAKEIKDAWIAKYGKWDFPDYMSTPCYIAVTQAMVKAGSIDVEAVTAALHQEGFTFNVPDGSMKMITRPDMRLDGNAVDAVSDNVLKKIHNKQPEILAHFSPDKSLEYARKAYPPLAPGQTPTITAPQ